MLFKAFAGILVLVSLGIYGLYKILHKRYEYLLIVFTSIFVAMSLFLISNTKLDSTLFASPFWFIKNMFWGHEWRLYDYGIIVTLVLRVF